MTAVGGGGDTQPQTDVVTRAKAALEGITPGPWEAIHHWHDTSYPSDTWHVITELTGDLVAEVDDESRGYEEPHGEFGRDATFIAAARSLVPELVAEVEKLRSPDLCARLRAFGRDCVRHGDMTPSAELMLNRILEDVR